MKLASASLAATLVVLAGAASDSHSVAWGPGLGLTAASPLVGERGELAGRARLDLRFRSARAGTFRIRGAISDTGSFRASQRVLAGRLQVTETLVGAGGTIRIRATQACKLPAGSWKVLSGAGGYAELTGGGAASGGPRCKRPAYPVRAAYTGLVRAPDRGPPPPFARVGHFGGATSQRQEVVFDVDQGGRAVTGLQLVVNAPCSGGQVPARRVSISLAGPHAIGDDRSFSARVESWWTGSVTGRFVTPTTAEGAALVETTVTSGSASTTYPCSANVSWQASLPSPAATPGTYCGSTSQGSSICLDVSPSGRDVVRAEVGVVAQCLPSGQFELKLRFAASTPIGGHLGFSQEATSFEGLTSGKASISGLFDADGVGASGRVFLAYAGIESGGRRYACRSVSATWTARR